MTNSPSVRTQTLELATADGPMLAHLAHPESAAPASLPAVIVFQEAFGVNGHIRAFCQRLAEQGYLVLAPELFHREGAGLVFGYDQWDRIRPAMGRLTNAGILADARASFDTLAGHPLARPNTVGAVGFCLGGFATMLAASHLSLRGAVSFYGGGMVSPRPGIGLTPILKDFAGIRAPVLLVFGEKDKGIPPEQVQAVREALARNGKSFEVAVYSGAQHGFFCDERPSFHPQAAQQAWDKTLAFLAGAMKSPA